MANRQTNEQLDRAGRLVLLSATGSEAETEAAASSPFVFTRTRAAIAEEKRRRDESGGWLPIFLSPGVRSQQWRWSRCWLRF